MFRVALLVSASFTHATVFSTPSTKENTITFTSHLQTGLFQPGDDVGAVNPHVYRPEEFAVNDLVYEGLTAYDESDPGKDGEFDTEDDHVVGSLATSWEDNQDAAKANSSVEYWIKFHLQQGVTFHDGEKFNAQAVKINFDHIWGTAGRYRKGFHDWYQLPFAIKSWEVESEYVFKITFNFFLSTALQELGLIRPARIISPMALPNIADKKLSCTENTYWKGYGPSKDYKCNQILAPYGTGPYKFKAKKLVKPDGSSRMLEADQLRASCMAEYPKNHSKYKKFMVCEYEEGETVSEYIFEKFDDYMPTPMIVKPTFKYAIMRSFNTFQEVQDALEDESLDLALGVSSMSPKGFNAIATREDDLLKAHIASTDLNTRYIGIHSGGALDTPELRKWGMCVMDRVILWEGELMEENPIDTLFDPTLPLMPAAANVLASIKSLCESSSSSPANVTQRPLRFLYPKGQAHIEAIVYIIIGQFAAQGIFVEPMGMTKDDYNAQLGLWVGEDGATGSLDYYEDNWTPEEMGGQGKNVTYDLVYSESWGPGYDALTSLNDIGYNYPAEAWSDITNYLDSITKKELNALITSIPQIIDDEGRQSNFTHLMQILNQEAVMLPITAKRNIAVTNNRLTGFRFSGLEFGTGSVLAALKPGSNVPKWEEKARSEGWAPCTKKPGTVATTRLRRRMLEKLEAEPLIAKEAAADLQMPGAWNQAEDDDEES